MEILNKYKLYLIGGLILIIAYLGYDYANTKNKLEEMKQHELVLQKEIQREKNNQDALQDTIRITRDSTNGLRADKLALEITYDDLTGRYKYLLDHPKKNTEYVTVTKIVEKYSSPSDFTKIEQTSDSTGTLTTTDSLYYDSLNYRVTTLTSGYYYIFYDQNGVKLPYPKKVTFNLINPSFSITQKMNITHFFTRDDQGRLVVNLQTGFRDLDLDLDAAKIIVEPEALPKVKRPRLTFGIQSGIGAGINPQQKIQPVLYLGVGFSYRLFNIL